MSSFSSPLTLIPTETFTFRRLEVNFSWITQHHLPFANTHTTHTHIHIVHFVYVFTHSFKPKHCTVCFWRTLNLCPIYQGLFLNGNQLDQIPDRLFIDLPQLTHLDLRSNRITRIPENLVRLTRFVGNNWWSCWGLFQRKLLC